MPTPIRSAVAAVWAMLTVVAAPLAAQPRVEVGPFVALYAPQREFAGATVYLTALPASPSDLAGMAWGGEARVWMSPQLGLQLQVASTSSNVGGGFTPGGPMPSMNARVDVAVLQALLRLRPEPSRVQVALGTGAGWIRHGGEAYAPYGNPVQLATALGLRGSVRMGSHLVAAAGLTTLLYNIDVSDDDGTSLEHGFQVDPLVHVGVSWVWP